MRGRVLRKDTCFYKHKNLDYIHDWWYKNKDTFRKVEAHVVVRRVLKADSSWHDIIYNRNKNVNSLFSAHDAILE